MFTVEKLQRLNQGVQAVDESCQPGPSKLLPPLFKLSWSTDKVRTTFEGHRDYDNHFLLSIAVKVLIPAVTKYFYIEL